uniref:Uncharacterized protein n=1 Tax=Saccharum spontaneum TaxID=62335 RepID=A0A678T8T9_SACSP|nr:hypothetical protein SS91I14_000011 [Saccharum spontaneum]
MALNHSPFHTTVRNLVACVSVDEVQHSLEHPWLQVIDTYMASSLLLHRAKEFRHEDRGPSTKYKLMCGERLIVDLERDVCFHP